MPSVVIEQYYNHLRRRIYFHFDIEAIYIRIMNLNEISTKVRYVEDYIRNYKSAIDDFDKKPNENPDENPDEIPTPPPVEYYASIEHKLKLNYSEQSSLEYRFGRYQHEIYLLLLNWKEALNKNQQLKIPRYIVESEFYLSYGKPIPLEKPKSLFLSGVDQQRYISIIPKNFINDQNAFIGTTSKTIFVAWYEALKEHGSIIHTQLTSEEAAKLINTLFSDLNINRRNFSGTQTSKVYEIYKPTFLKLLKEM